MGVGLCHNELVVKKALSFGRLISICQFVLVSRSNTPIIQLALPSEFCLIV
jgi:hypothetical protein